MDDQVADFNDPEGNVQKRLIFEQKKHEELSWFQYANLAVLRDHLYDFVKNLKLLARQREGMDLAKLEHFADFWLLIQKVIDVLLHWSLCSMHLAFIKKENHWLIKGN